MNNYEKFGRATTPFIHWFIVGFALTAVCGVFLNLFLPTLPPWEDLLLYSIFGTIFGISGGLTFWDCKVLIKVSKNDENI